MERYIQNPALEKKKSSEFEHIFCTIYYVKYWYNFLKVYIPDTTTTKQTTATTKTTPTEQLTTITKTTEKTTPRTTTNTLIPMNKISTSREIQTLTSGLLASKPEQPRAHTTYPFTKATDAYVPKEKGKLKQIGKYVRYI